MKIFKKLLIAGTGIAISLFLLLSVIDYFWPEVLTPPIDPASYVRSFNVTGRSMEPTLMNGSLASYNVSLKPEINSVVAFDCFTEKCINGENPNKVKRLIKINEQGCYWFEGDNPDHSWDSRNYGWLCGNDVKIQGVVIN